MITYVECGAATFTPRGLVVIPSAGGVPVETQGKGAELGIGKLLSSSVAVQDDLDIGPVQVVKSFPFGSSCLVCLVPYVDRSGTRVFNTVYDNPSTLGCYFPTGAYLMMDHDAGTFTIWQANPTRESTEGKCGDTTKPGPSSSGSGPPTASSSNSSTTPILSAGSIAGVAV
ncbi:hypothetical protein GGR58DRAFT_497311 [Xylaria digitata]|nr:hypothetical protein GGR58DRAFT_497311 [Xylaria digitata]